MALTADRLTDYRVGDLYSYPVAAAKKIYAGSIVVLDSAGNAEPATLATGKIAVGIAQEQIDNSSGDAADLSVVVRRGTHKLKAQGTVNKTSIGDVVYMYDDQSVQTSATSTSAVGILRDVESDGVWVEITPPLVSAGLAAANNLSDVGTAATAATNLGLGAASDVTFGTVTAADLTSTDDVIVGDDLNVTGLATVGETLAVVGAITGLKKVSTVALNTLTVANTDGGIVVLAAADNDVVTLPDAAAANKGCVVTVINMGNDDAAKVSISPHSSDKIIGTLAAVSASGEADKDFISVKSGANKGDYCRLVSDGVDSWVIIGGVGVWASEA